LAFHQVAVTMNGCCKVFLLRPHPSEYGVLIKEMEENMSPAVEASSRMRDCGDSR
jgi:hypothetical protein